MKTTIFTQIALILLLFLAGKFVIAQNTGINTTTPNADADLHLGSDNKGLLLNNVALVSTDDSAPLPGHIRGMIVFNTATSGTPPFNVVPGIYFNSGAEWVPLQASNANLNTITSPIGVVRAYASNTIPGGWLKCNGQEVKRSVYASLFSVIGTTYGAGDGSTTFNLPDLRGEFVRGWDNGRGIDPGRQLGSFQNDEIQSHDHLTWNGNAYSTAFLTNLGGLGLSGSGTFSGLLTGENSSAGPETRPRNVAMNYIIKF